MKGVGADEPYWLALSAGQLKLPECSACGKAHWPAVWRCGECGSWEQQWTSFELSGTIFSWARTWHEFGASKEFGLPYVSVVVEIDNAGGRRLLGTIAGNAENIRIGDRVHGEVISVNIEDESIPALRWHLDSNSSTSKASNSGATL